MFSLEAVHKARAYLNTLEGGICIYGPPSSGKDTQAMALAQMFSLHAISIGDIMRKANTQAFSNIHRGALAKTKDALALMEDEFSKHRAQGNVFISAGSPRKLAEAKALAPFFDVIIVIKGVGLYQGMIRQRARRATCRKTGTTLRQDDRTALIFLRRFIVYHLVTGRVLRFLKKLSKKGGLTYIAVDGRLSATDVTAQIIDALSNL